ncbi:MAG: efflux RND transporter periplasmic adaptor subunit [Myxococcota bacterium]|nr:efflux RND transporter periplasmic adaptor subunit [Myxococcota bacterium]
METTEGPTRIRDTAGTDRALERPRWQVKRRWIVFAVLGIAVLVGGGVVVKRWAGGEKSIDGARLRIAAVAKGTLVRDAAVTGRVVAAVSPTLYAPMPGTVALKIRAGDQVKKGDELAVIDSPELENELKREQSTLAQIEAQLGSARIQTDKTRLQAKREADEAAIALTAATREVQANERAFQQGVIAEVELLRSRDALESARVRDKNAKSLAGLSGQSAGFDLKTAQQQFERQKLAIAELERRVGELHVKAPVDGVIGTLAVADRAVVPVNAPLMTVVDLSQLEVELEIPETYADDLGLGMKAEVKIANGNAVGTLSALSPEVVKNNVLARVRFGGQQPAGLRQSQRVSARILIEERADVLMLPRGPFLEAHGGKAAYVVNDGIATKRTIRVGVTSVGQVEILEGLEPGERVVIAGSADFDNAETVRIND